MSNSTISPVQTPVSAQPNQIRDPEKPRLFAGKHTITIADSASEDILAVFMPDSECHVCMENHLRVIDCCSVVWCFPCYLNTETNCMSHGKVEDHKKKLELIKSGEHKIKDFGKDHFTRALPVICPYETFIQAAENKQSNSQSQEENTSHCEYSCGKVLLGNAREHFNKESHKNISITNLSFHDLNARSLEQRINAEEEIDEIFKKKPIAAQNTMQKIRELTPALINDCHIILFSTVTGKLEYLKAIGLEEDLCLALVNNECAKNEVKKIYNENNVQNVQKDVMDIPLSNYSEDERLPIAIIKIGNLLTKDDLNTLRFLKNIPIEVSGNDPVETFFRMIFYMSHHNKEKYGAITSSQLFDDLPELKRRINRRAHLHDPVDSGSENLNKIMDSKMCRQTYPNLLKALTNLSHAINIKSCIPLAIACKKEHSVANNCITVEGLFREAMSAEVTFRPLIQGLSADQQFYALSIFERDLGIV